MKTKFHKALKPKSKQLVTNETSDSIKSFITEALLVTSSFQSSGVFRGGGHGEMPPLWPDHENFLPATLYEKVRILPFSSKNCKIQQYLMVFCVSKFQKNGRICGFH